MKTIRIACLRYLLPTLLSVRAFCADGDLGSAPQPVNPWPAAPGSVADGSSGPADHSPQPAPAVLEEEVDGTWDLTVSYRRPLNGDYEAVHRALTSFSLAHDSRTWMGLEAGGGLLELKRGTWASAVARDPVVLEAGLVFRHTFTHSKAFVQPYIGASFGWFVFIWDYREPIVTEEETIHTDYVWGIDPSVSFGVNLRPLKCLNIFGEVEAGGMILAECHTDREVENNFFDSFGYFGFRAGLRLAF